jgi:hypothetical protein
MNRTLTVILMAMATAAAVTVHAQTSTPIGPQTITPRSSAEPTNQSAEEIIIKEKIKAAGVSKVNSLVRNPDGSWEGKGIKDKNEVAVLVDTDGNIRFQ